MTWSLHTVGFSVRRR